jgi:hypothetical protein
MGVIRVLGPPSFFTWQALTVCTPLAIGFAGVYSFHWAQSLGQPSYRYIGPYMDVIWASVSAWPYIYSSLIRFVACSYRQSSA